MKFICATRTNGHRVFINLDDIMALEYQATDNLQYTAVCLRNGREIDVTGTPEDLLQAANRTVNTVRQPSFDWYLRMDTPTIRRRLSCMHLDARHYATDALLRDGSSVHIRAIRPDDKHASLTSLPT